MPILDMMLIFFFHWVSDFVLQSNDMATKKSSSVKWLSIHVSVYMLPFFWFGWQFALINAAVHWIVDFFTSKATSYYWQKNEMHWFFTVVGFDQLLHMVTLFGTYYLLFM